MPELSQGRIVWAEVVDPNGQNKYSRPVIILTPNHEIPSAETLVCVVASHTAALKVPRPPSYIELPYQPQGRVGTKLRKSTVAVCDWIVEIEKKVLLAGEMGGRVSFGLLELILDKVREIHGDDPTKPPIGPGNPASHS